MGKIRLEDVDAVLEPLNERGILRGVGSSGLGRRTGAEGGVDVRRATHNWSKEEDVEVGGRTWPYISISVVSGPPTKRSTK